MPKPSKTSLFAAAKAWDAPACAAILSQAPALAKAADPKGRTALHIACGIRIGTKGLREADGTKTVAVLAKGGCDLNAIAFTEGAWKANAVWYAVGRGQNVALTRYLLKRGVSPDYAVFAAIYSNNPDTLRALLRYDPKVDWSDEPAPILWATTPFRLKALDVLIEHGADPLVTDKRGRNALDLAKFRRLPPEVRAKLEALAARHRKAKR
jgi:ankyrin repeat protein